MSGVNALAVAGGLAAGGAAALLVARVALQAPAAALLRVNYRGVTVPAVLGGPLLAGTGSAIVVMALWTGYRETAFRPEIAGAVAAVAAIMCGAGFFDDRRGDELPRGFRGHLRAFEGGSMTGGIVKLFAGALAGVVGGLLVADRLVVIIEVALLVGLTANLFNLLDRAPGRAGKTGVAVASVLLLSGTPSWGLAASGLIGALLVILPLDLKERAMLGDAGANALGAVLGLGVAEALDEPPRVAAVVLLLLLNLASERWSFSRIIEATPPLRALDRLGRK